MAKAVVIKPVEYMAFNGKSVNEVKKVAAYCRVSTDSEEQLNSYQAQVSYYKALIQNNTEWEFVDIYADEGISGTNSLKRTEFLRMIKDAKDGKIDIILTKSISRFARNTVDILRYTRELKEYGVAVKFEKENINTMEASGEIFLTIFSSLAQEESRSISENSRWGIVKGFKDGKVFCNTTRFLGYDKDDNGNLVINEKEAQIVRRIYQEYLDGKSYSSIARGLEKDNIPTVTGSKKWWDSSVTIILTNEKYYGALLQQKTVTIDFLTHKRVKNKGFADKYLIEDNHDPIISKEVFEKVQAEKERRAKLKNNIKNDRGKYSSKYPFSGKIVCSKCGSTYRRRTWNSDKSCRRVVWQCKTYVKEGKNECDAKAVYDEVIEDAFVDVFNRMKTDKDGFIQVLSDNIQKVLAQSGYMADIEKLDKEIKDKKDELKSLIKLQTTGVVDKEVYNEEYERISNELNEYRDRRAKYEKDVRRKEELRLRTDEIMKVLHDRVGLLEQFDGDIFNALVEKIEVIEPTHFVFVLKSGMNMEVNDNIC